MKQLMKVHDAGNEQQLEAHESDETVSGQHTGTLLHVDDP